MSHLKNDDVPVAAEERRNRLSFFTFFRRSTKKNGKSSSESTPTEDAEKLVQINENEPEPKKTEEKDETIQEATKDESHAENDDPSDIKDVNDDKLPTEEAPEFPVGDNANIGDVLINDGPNNDEKMKIDDIVETSVNLIVEASMNEVEQK